MNKAKEWAKIALSELRVEFPYSFFSLSAEEDYANDFEDDYYYVIDSDNSSAAYLKLIFELSYVNMILKNIEFERKNELYEKSLDIQFNQKNILNTEEPQNVSLPDFAKIHAPAHIFPYLRELISSTTARAGLPIVMLPPTNLHTITQSNVTQ